MHADLLQLELEISNPCNERCVHCYRINEETRKGFLSLIDVKKIVADIKPILAERLQATLTGGEATLNPEWREILQYLIDEKFRVTLFTNGTLLDEQDVLFLSQFDKTQLKEVQLSLYAMNAEVHDSITLLRGSFEKTIASIKMMHSADIPIFISCPAMQANKDDFYKVMSWADENNIPSCSDLYIFSSSNYSFSNEGQKLNDDDLEKFYKITQKNNGDLSYVWKSKRKKNLNKILFYGGATDSILVSGDGNIYPMIGWYKKLGNIKTDNLADVFLHSPLLKKNRTVYASDIPECKECKVVDYCSFCPTVHLNANNGELYKLDKSFCEYVAKVKHYAEKDGAQ